MNASTMNQPLYVHVHMHKWYNRPLHSQARLLPTKRHVIHITIDKNIRKKCMIQQKVEGGGEWERYIEKALVCA